MSNPEFAFEAHIFDYSGDLYGRNIAVRLKDFVRSPVNNPSLEELRSLIKKDAEVCRELNQQLLNTQTNIIDGLAK